MEQRIMTTKSTCHPGHQQMISSRTRSMPYPSPSMYNHSSGSVCQCTSHMYYPSQHQMYYQTYPIKNKIQSKSEESFVSSTSYHPSICSNSYIPAQQLTPISQEYQTFSNQSQIFPSPPSNPSTPYQSEFNANTEFGVPYNHGQPSSVNSLTDALCPSGDTNDRQLTPGPPVRSKLFPKIFFYRFIVIECWYASCCTTSIFISTNSINTNNIKIIK